MLVDFLNMDEVAIPHLNKWEQRRICKDADGF